MRSITVLQVEIGSVGESGIETAGDVEARKAHLCVVEQVVGDGMIDRKQAAISKVGVTDVILRIGTVAGGSVKVVFAVTRKAEEHLGLGAKVIVHASHEVIGILRNAAAGVKRSTKVDGIEYRC